MPITQRKEPAAPRSLPAHPPGSNAARGLPAPRTWRRGAGRRRVVRRGRTTAAFVLLAMLVAAQARATAPGGGYFETPSRNISCFYEYGAHIAEPLIECGIRSGLEPAPPRGGAACRELDYVGNRLSLAATGRARPIACAGDAGPFAAPGATRVLAYGSVWRGGGLSCSSEVTGLTCRNTAGHGFFLSRQAWHGF
jgi:hypothetical protein